MSSSLSEHKCHAIGCERKVSPKMLMCLQHWRMVPSPMQKQIWKYYREGQEEDKQASAEYLVASRIAIQFVATKEGR